MEIKNVEGMSVAQIQQEIQKGGKFVIYQYTISIIISTFKRSSDIRFIKSDESAIVPGLGYSFLTLILGWWGIPWGPIYTIGSFIQNFGGGKDVTKEVMAQIAGNQQRQAAGGGTPTQNPTQPTRISDLNV